VGPPETVTSLIAADLPRHTDTTITDPDRLLAELDEIRARGCATNYGEWRADVGSVAAILGNADEPVASVSVNLPRTRLTEESQTGYGVAASEAARSISDRLGHRPVSARHHRAVTAPPPPI
jgi:IclR family acetate operon transcriptional repressor